MNLRQHEEEELEKDYGLLKELEDELRNEDELRKQRKLEKDIKEIKQRIQEREREIKGVKPQNQLILEGYELLKNKKFAQAEEKFDEAKRLDSQSPESWYWKARVAIAKDNKPVALEYIRKALQLNEGHLSSLVLQIKILLLMGGNYRGEAKIIASQIYGMYDELNCWLDCLEKENLFSSIVLTSYELEKKCPISIDDGKIV
ncbi:MULTISPECIES: hypothetical protein [unclassified Tolypothrix]|uniref:hypothetical protein n=1 Tax=unclassified Tolypothrix TaxID=2649714 RepID=UPI0005EAB591|nr:MULTISPECIES: hypothetical protein [unclassified Tolypothrix]BAY95740.1 hypothetical protein NIES3275_78170 [Microchaete diplosiphon NIES-3275]EKE97266.1 tetratricopeptide repeat protein [Tolypothrix sp. PCC 7601]MBE9082286.1 hypothetical protein [Tolypothrix sp. LEGE 11397]UYD30704.1 hypothetical protein HGR01_38375 [Tolypothrix sp. PCC 7712]UYD38640.1 hypothetical protein HG267_39775 [Tolypothrix sp. PCC 7601]